MQCVRRMNAGRMLQRPKAPSNVNHGVRDGQLGQCVAIFESAFMNLLRHLELRPAKILSRCHQDQDWLSHFGSSKSLCLVWIQQSQQYLQLFQLPSAFHDWSASIVGQQVVVSDNDLHTCSELVPKLFLFDLLRLVRECPPCHLWRDFKNYDFTTRLPCWNDLRHGSKTLTYLDCSRRFLLYFCVCLLLTRWPCGFWYWYKQLAWLSDWETCCWWSFQSLLHTWSYI